MEGEQLPCSEQIKHLDTYLDLARLALKTAIPGIVMLAIAPLAYRILMRLHASQVVRSEDRSETWRLFQGRLGFLVFL